MQNLKLENVSQIILSEILCSRITKIAHKYRSEGLLFDSIEYFFRKEFLDELFVQKLGFESIEDLINNVLTHNYPIEIRNDKEGDQRLYSNLNQYYYWLSVMKMSKKFEIMDIMVDVPQDVIPCGQQLPPFEFPNSVKLNPFPEIVSGNILNELNYTKVKIMSAISPHELYLQLCEDNYYYSYHKLRNEMKFYDKRENDSKYRIPSLLLMKGLLCAAKYGDICKEWHRMKILSVDKDNNVTLESLDIGAIIVEKVVNLRLLKKEFASLPSQAIRVQLTGIRPFGKKNQFWTNSAKTIVMKLQDFCYAGNIECAFIDFQNDRFRVFIKYYNRYKSIDINDLLFLHELLVNKQLAVITGIDFPVH